MERLKTSGTTQRSSFTDDSTSSCQESTEHDTADHENTRVSNLSKVERRGEENSYTGGSTDTTPRGLQRLQSDIFETIRKNAPFPRYPDMTQEKLILRALSFIVKLLWNIFLDLRKGQSPEPLFREGTLLAADLETYFKEHTLVVVQSEGKPS